jgi:transcriptional regulator with XRE-family HTH domain
MKKLNLAEKIKQARKLTGESQRKFAERFGVTTAAVSLWESGKREASYEVIKFALERTSSYEVCPTCKGSGVVKKKHE